MNTCLKTLAVVCALFAVAQALKCNVGVGDKAAEIDCTDAVTSCYTYTLNDVKTFSCGACPSTLKDCTDCTTALCNSGVTLSASIVFTILPALYYLLF